MWLILLHSSDYATDKDNHNDMNGVEDNQEKQVENWLVAFQV